MFGVRLPCALLTNSVHGLWSPHVKRLIHSEACFGFLLLRWCSGAWELVVYWGVCFLSHDTIAALPNWWDHYQRCEIALGTTIEKVCLFATKIGYINSITLKYFCCLYTKKKCFLTMMTSFAPDWKKEKNTSFTYNNIRFSFKLFTSNIEPSKTSKLFETPLPNTFAGSGDPEWPSDPQLFLAFASSWTIYPRSFSR